MEICIQKGVDIEGKFVIFEEDRFDLNKIEELLNNRFIRYLGGDIVKGCLYFLLAVVLIVGVGILLPAWLLQIVLGAFDINIDLWVCILIFVLLNMIGGMFKGS